jgi:ATP-dependent DNA helicase RecG
MTTMPAMIHWARTRSSDHRQTQLTFFTPQVSPQATPQDSPQVTPQVEKLLKTLRGEMSRSDLMKRAEIKDRKYFSEKFLQPALERGLIEITQPDKPNSSQQRYRLTPLGQTIRATITK